MFITQLNLKDAIREGHITTAMIVVKMMENGMSNVDLAVTAATVGAERIGAKKNAKTR